MRWRGEPPSSSYNSSKILSPDLARTVLSFSGAERAAQRPVDWLNLKFNSPQLMIPIVYQELKDIAPQRHRGAPHCRTGAEEGQEFIGINEE